MKKIFIFFIFILFFVSFSTAYTELPYVNLFDFQSNTTRGLFNDVIDLDDITYTSKTLNDARYAPLIYDLDKDGIFEIIAIGDDTMRVYHHNNNVYSILYSETFTYDDFSNIVIDDWEGDGTIEMLFFNFQKDTTNGRLHIRTWNGSVLAEERGSDYTPYKPAVHDDFWLMCQGGGVGFCGFVGIFDGANVELIAQSFNTTDISGIGTSTTMIQGISEKCFPAIKTNDMQDNNGDGYPEMFTSYISLDTSSQVGVGVHRIEWGQAPLIANPSVFLIDQETRTGLTDVDTITCRNSDWGYAHKITAPVFADIDDNFNGEELIWALLEDEDEFRLRYYKMTDPYTYDLQDEYPEFGITFDADGRYLSNLAVGTIFNLVRDDVCVAGYQKGETQPYDTTHMTILCASPSDEDNEEFVVTTGLNQSYSYDKMPLIYAVQTKQEVIEGENKHEIMTPFGIYYFSSNTDVDLIFDYDVDSLAGVPIDYNKVDRFDIVGLTGETIVYIDDGFNNLDCNGQDCIVDVTTNPSIDDIIQINTTFQVGVTVEDNEGDLVSARVILYYGDNNEQDTGWLGNFSSGHEFLIGSLKVNKTITSGVLHIMARESSNPSAIETLDFSFTVALQGVEFGESSFSFVPEPDAEEEGETDLEDNAITNTLDTLTGESGLGRGVVWLFFIIVAVIAVMAGLVRMQSVTSGQFYMAIGMAMFVAFMMLFLGAKLGYVSTGTVVGIIVVALAIVAVVVARTIAGARS